jgi:hypothetical protein
MDVFSLRDTVVGEYRKFATSFTTIHADDIRRQVEGIYAEGRFWPEPLIQINPSQLEELDKFIENVPGAKPVTFARIPARRTQRNASASPRTRPTSCSPTS